MNDAYFALTLVTGSRAWDDIPVIEDALLETWHDARQDGWPGMTVMHGGAVGADTIAGRRRSNTVEDAQSHQCARRGEGVASAARFH